MIEDRVTAIIELKALLKNYETLKLLNHGKDVYAVVKADAYGHGSKECSKYLFNHGVKHFAVTALKEAIELREFGIGGEILIFGKTDKRNAIYLEKFNLVQTVDSFSYADELNDQGYKIDVHVNVDTGMSRLGVVCHHEKDIANAALEIRNISLLDNIGLKGIYTHFTSADSDKDFTIYQEKVFLTLLKELRKINVDYGKVHIKNSAGLNILDSNNYDLARSGIALYGYPPVESDFDFFPVMTVLAKVIALREIEKEETVSYGRTFMAEKKIKVATIAIGYADGYMRVFSNKDYFFYKNHKLKVLGRVCMGLTMVDATDVDIKIGDEVEVFGRNKPLEPMAKIADTITYELLCNMAKSRVKREFIE